MERYGLLYYLKYLDSFYCYLGVDKNNILYVFGLNFSSNDYPMNFIITSSNDKKYTKKIFKRGRCSLLKIAKVKEKEFHVLWMLPKSITDANRLQDFISNNYKSVFYDRLSMSKEKEMLLNFGEVKFNSKNSDIIVKDKYSSNIRNFFEEGVKKNQISKRNNVNDEKSQSEINEKMNFEQKLKRYDNHEQVLKRYGNHEQSLKGYGNHEQNLKGYGNHEQSLKGYGNHEQSLKGYGNHEQVLKRYGNHEQSLKGYGNHEQSLKGYDYPGHRKIRWSYKGSIKQIHNTPIDVNHKSNNKLKESKKQIEIKKKRWWSKK